MVKFRKPTKKELVHNVLTTLVFLSSATIISYLIMFFGGFTNNGGMVYILAVVFISRFSHGYISGVIASFFRIFFVDYIFTYPYMEFKGSGI